MQRWVMALTEKDGVAPATGMGQQAGGSTIERVCPGWLDTPAADSVTEREA